MNVFNITWITITTPVACRQQNNSQQHTKSNIEAHTHIPACLPAVYRKVLILFFETFCFSHWFRHVKTLQVTKGACINNSLSWGQKQEPKIKIKNYVYFRFHLNFATLWHKFKRHAFINTIKTNLFTILCIIPINMIVIIIIIHIIIHQPEFTVSSLHANHWHFCFCFFQFASPFKSCQPLFSILFGNLFTQFNSIQLSFIIHIVNPSVIKIPTHFLFTHIHTYIHTFSIFNFFILIL